ncbi:hypothetical protein BSKO_09694 [Bryopsis sp. KO-2023]|nr:hypothetical protein BSKO_09694 [Bryopsis sp. KO-2023]
MSRVLMNAVVALLCVSAVVGRRIKTTGGYAASLGFEKCEPEQLVRPKSIADLAKIIQEANINGKSVKAVGARKSTTDIICTDGVAVDMSNIADININKKAKTVTVQAGATLRDLQRALSKEGLSLTLPSVKFSGVTIGGALATGSHTSSLRHPTSISDSVTSLNVFDSRGELVEVQDDFLKATRVNLGVLGIVVDVTMDVVKEFKIRVENVDTKEKLLFNKKKLTKMANEFDVFQIGWFPSLNKIVATQGTFVKASSKGKDHVDYGFVTNQYTSGFVLGVEKAHRKRNLDAFCNMEESSFMSTSVGQPGLLPYVNKKGEFQNPAVGYISDMMTQYCEPETCSWDYPGPKFLAQELTVGIPLDRVPEAAMRIKEIMEERPVCFSTSSGIGIRFHKASENYLSIAEGVDTAVFEILVPLRQKGTQPRLGLDTIQLLQQTLLSDEFSGRPHWGSNSKSAFANPFPEPSELFPNFDKFLSVKQILDPIGMFDNSFYRRFIREEDLPKGNRCAVNEKCICSLDSHCAKKQKCLTVDAGSFVGGICVNK